MPVVDILRQAYSDEIETVANYLALSVSLDGVRAEEIKERLEEDVNEELEHAKSVARRLKELGQGPQGSLLLEFRQRALQPPSDTTDLRAVVDGVLEAEEDAVRTYRDLIEAARREDDPVTEDLAIRILAQEERHRSLFRGYKLEIDKVQERRAEEQRARR